MSSSNSSMAGKGAQQLVSEQSDPALDPVFESSKGGSSGHGQSGGMATERGRASSVEDRFLSIEGTMEAIAGTVIDLNGKLDHLSCKLDRMMVELPRSGRDIDELSRSRHDHEFSNPKLRQSAPLHHSPLHYFTAAPTIPSHTYKSVHMESETRIQILTAIAKKYKGDSKSSEEQLQILTVAAQKYKARRDSKAIEEQLQEPNIGKVGELQLESCLKNLQDDSMAKVQNHPLFHNSSDRWVADDIVPMEHVSSSFPVDNPLGNISHLSNSLVTHSESTFQMNTSQSCPEVKNDDTYFRNIDHDVEGKHVNPCVQAIAHNAEVDLSQELPPNYSDCRQGDKLSKILRLAEMKNVGDLLDGLPFPMSVQAYDNHVFSSVIAFESNFLKMMFSFTKQRAVLVINRVTCTKQLEVPKFVQLHSNPATKKWGDENIGSATCKRGLVFWLWDPGGISWHQFKYLDMNLVQVQYQKYQPLSKYQASSSSFKPFNHSSFSIRYNSGSR